MKIVIKEIDGSVIGNKVNLCDSCKHEYSVCTAGSEDVFFGDGAGNDNVCCCALYVPRRRHKMNHDHTHCADFTENCPRGCFRAQLVRDLQRFGKLAPYGINFPISWAHLKGTEECKKKEKK